MNCERCGRRIVPGQFIRFVHAETPSGRPWFAHSARPAPQKAAHDLAGAGALSSRDDGLPSEAPDPVSPDRESVPPSRGVVTGTAG